MIIIMIMMKAIMMSRVAKRLDMSLIYECCKKCIAYQEYVVHGLSLIKLKYAFLFY